MVDLYAVLVAHLFNAAVEWVYANLDYHWRSHAPEAVAAHFWRGAQDRILSMQTNVGANGPTGTEWEYYDQHLSRHFFRDLDPALKKVFADPFIACGDGYPVTYLAVLASLEAHRRWEEAGKP